jgi:arabinofuranosyltransferase
MIKTAWIGDDAYISFRPLDNLLNGYGLRWNVSERVQVYTDPAWLVLVGLSYAITGEIFITVILLSIAVSFAAVFLLVRNVASSHAAAIAALCALVSSKAFIDYTTSGLENALGYLLAAAFCVCLLRPQLNFEKYRWLVLLGSCAAFNRLDAALLFGPAILYIGWLSWRVEKVPVLRLLRRSILYSVPLWGWILFSLIYFGFAFPNTYYAKIYTGLPKGELFTQGILYYFNSINRDPVTLITLAFALVVVVRSRDARLIAAAVGIALYLLYIVKIGGDFMSGRFFSVPLIFAVALLISVKLRPAAWLGLAIGFVGLGWFRGSRRFSPTRLTAHRPCGISGRNWSRTAWLIRGASPMSGPRIINTQDCCQCYGTTVLAPRSSRRFSGRRRGSRGDI